MTPSAPTRLLSRPALTILAAGALALSACSADAPASFFSQEREGPVAQPAHAPPPAKAPEAAPAPERAPGSETVADPEPTSGAETIPGVEAAPEGRPAYTLELPLTGPGAEPGTETESGALAIDWCDDALFEDAAWRSEDLGDFTFTFLPGTAAEADLAGIAAVRQAQYEALSARLGLTERPHVTLVLSPSRRAARHHGLGVGTAYPAHDWIEVLYLDGESSYEQRRPAHELTHVLAAHVDGRPYHLPFLDEGLAELLDGSERDLHEAYARKLQAGVETRAFVTRLEDSDRYGRNYGRAGSFVQLLVERYGFERFLELFRLAAVTWSGPDLTTTLGHRVQDGQSLEAALDAMLRQVYGRSLEALRLEWQAALDPWLEAPPAVLSDADLSEILQVVQAADRAMTTDDAVAFRATVDGFYCDGWDDDDRARLATGAVAGYASVQTAVVAVYPVGVRNYPEVKVHAVQRTVSGSQEAYAVVELTMEQFPIGWRITWSTAW